ncbi:MAG: pyridoxine 5'-phosphate synthase [bacterium]
MLELGVNVDHVATVREARGIQAPDPVEAALVAENNGADLITVHLRLDRRHIQERDLEVLTETVKTGVNLEMAVAGEMIDKALEYRPFKATLVPEDRQEVTTEGGLDAVGAGDKVSAAINKLQQAGIMVSLFVDPDKKQLAKAAECGADGVELHTGDYAETEPYSADRERALDRLFEGAKQASDFGLEVYAGHGLNYQNVQPVAGIKSVTELNIGHSIVGRAVIEGFATATRKMKKLIKEAEI